MGFGYGPFVDLESARRYVVPDYYDDNKNTARFVAMRVTPRSRECRVVDSATGMQLVTGGVFLYLVPPSDASQFYNTFIMDARGTLFAVVEQTLRKVDVVASARHGEIVYRYGLV